MKKMVVLYNGNEPHYRHCSRRQWHKILVDKEKARKSYRRIITKRIPRWRQRKKAWLLGSTTGLKYQVAWGEHV